MRWEENILPDDSQTVLVLVGTGLIFFTVAPTVLCFGFVTKTVLMFY